MKHFTLEEREILAEMLEKGRSYRDIAKVVLKAISSISDERKRGLVNGQYCPFTAHRRAQMNRLRKGKRKKLDMRPELKTFIIEKIREEQWSPEQIAGDLKRVAGKTVISHETIYSFVYSAEGKKEKLWLSMRHKKWPQRKSWGRKQRCTIPNRVSIHERPEEVNRRERFGDYEGDLMVFSDSKKALAVFVERKTRKVVAVVNENKTASEMETALHELSATVGIPKLRSITFDNGGENVCHEQVRYDYNYAFDTYFCDPYSSWQKGSVENANKLLRQYFPRWMKDEDITQDYLDTVVQKINNRPRKCLGFLSANAAFNFCSV